MNSPKKNKFSKEIEEQLQGFEELFEGYLIEEEKKELDRLKRDSKNENSNYDLIHFLMEEIDRLSKVDTFFTKKIPVKVNFSQDEKLLKIQHDKKNQIKEELINEFLTFDSPLITNISKMFNTHFS